MRVTREKAAENREKIVATAARLFREHGFDGVGLDAIMESAGLTHGGFYRHFRSKNDLAAEAVAHGLADQCRPAGSAAVPGGAGLRLSVAGTSRQPGKWLHDRGAGQ